MFRRFGSAFALFATASTSVSLALPPVVLAGAADDSGLLNRVSAYVERYYARAQTLVATETVVVQPLGRDMESFGPPRRVVNELRIEWDPAGTEGPRTIRQQFSASGPRLGPPDRPDCYDPRSLSPEPLAILLPGERQKFRFRVGPTELVAGTRAQRIDYTTVNREAPKVDWQGKCGMIRNAGPTRGSVWVNPASGEILRFDEHLVRAVDLPGPPAPDGREAPRSFRMERGDMLIDYKPIAFADPDETILLPSRVETLSVIRDSAVPRVRIVVTLTDYRRFLTAGRVLP